MKDVDVANETKSEFVASGFFALRTPLLSFDELLAWTDDLEASVSLADPARLDQALNADRAKLQLRLREIISRPEIREALFVASPHLEEAIELWAKDHASERGRGIELALIRYFLRMSGRATPFGLCAGCSVGKIDNVTRLAISPRSEWTRNTRLDMDYLASLTDALAADSKLCDAFVYRPNSSLYRAAGRLRYAESHLQEKERQRLRSYQLVAVDETETLNAVLAAARDGKSFAQLANAIVDQEISLADAEEFVATLIANQILVPDIHLTVTGTEANESLIKQFAAHPLTTAIADVLAKVQDRLVGLDKNRLGNSPGKYRETAQLLGDLPAKLEPSHFVQVELVKPAPELTLGRNVANEILRGMKLLQRIARPARTTPDELTQFRDAFAMRYEQRRVPLTEALDGEIGIGFPVGSTVESEESPLLKELNFPNRNEPTARWDAREKLLLCKIDNAVRDGLIEIALDQQEIETLSAPEPPPLPASFAVAAIIEAKSETALTRGEFSVLLQGMRGPSGAVLLGRFCHADPGLRAEVEEHLRAEEALRPDAIFAEIVHLPEGRMGNILARPILRAYEIPYLAHAGVAPDHQIPVTDLFLKIDKGKLRLYSARLGREIIPRLTSAHNFSWRGVPIYRFLATLQYQNGAPLSWNWGALESAPFLPRLTSGKLVISRARWRVEKKELRSIAKQTGAEQFRSFQAWRASRRLPRFAALADADNELPFDLDNVLCVATLIDRIKSRDDATLVELFPAPDALCAHGPEGRYVHEVIVPFVRTDPEKPPRERRFTVHDSQFTAPRSFPPGSEWLFAKLYTGTATADRILIDTVAPLVRQLRDSGVIDRWFFIRYGDPDWHVRLRFHGPPEVLRNSAMPAIESAAAPLLADGRVWRLQYDTYEREIERYGGFDAMLLAEDVFQIDSEAVLEILDLLEPGSAGADERWRLTLCGIDALVTDLGFDLPTKARVLNKVRTEFAKEFKIDAKFKAQLSERFRKERKGLEGLFAPGHDARNALAPGFEIFGRRSARSRPVMDKLKTLEQSGGLTMSIFDLAPSYIHMHANRLLRSAQRAHELVLYDFLARLYESQLARRATSASPQN